MYEQTLVRPGRANGTRTRTRVGGGRWRRHDDARREDLGRDLGGRRVEGSGTASGVGGGGRLVVVELDQPRRQAGAGRQAWLADDGAAPVAGIGRCDVEQLEQVEETVRADRDGAGQDRVGGGTCDGGAEVAVRGGGHEDHPHAEQAPLRIEPRRRRPVTAAIVAHGSSSAWIGHRNVVTLPSVW